MAAAGLVVHVEGGTSVAGGSSHVPEAEEVLHLLGQGAHTDRLLDVAVEPGGERPLAVVVHGEGGDGHDRYRAGGGPAVVASMTSNP